MKCHRHLVFIVSLGTTWRPLLLLLLLLLLLMLLLLLSGCCLLLASDCSLQLTLLVPLLHPLLFFCVSSQACK